MKTQKFDEVKSVVAADEQVKGYSLHVPFDKLEAFGIGFNYTADGSGFDLFLAPTARGIDLQEVYSAIDDRLLSLGVSHDKALELAEIACNAIEAHELKARLIELLK